MPEHPMYLAECEEILRNVLKRVIGEHQRNAVIVEWEPILAQVKLYLRFGVDVDVLEARDVRRPRSDVQPQVIHLLPEVSSAVSHGLNRTQRHSPRRPSAPRSVDLLALATSRAPPTTVCTAHRWVAIMPLSYARRP